MAHCPIKKEVKNSDVDDDGEAECQVGQTLGLDC